MSKVGLMVLFVGLEKAVVGSFERADVTRQFINFFGTLSFFLTLFTVMMMLVNSHQMWKNCAVRTHIALLAVGGCVALMMSDELLLQFCFIVAFITSVKTFHPVFIIYWF